MNNAKENMVTKWLIELSNKIKYGFVALAVCYFFLILSDVFIHKSNISVNIFEYIKTLVICISVWFGVKFVFWFQIKNPCYSEMFFNIASVFVLIVTLLMSIVNIVSFILYGFNSGAFVFPVISLSVVKVQKSRKERDN